MKEGYYSKMRRKSIFYRQRQIYKYFYKAGYSESSVKSAHWTIFVVSFAVVTLLSLLMIFVFLKAYESNFTFAVVFLTMTFGLALVFFLILSFFYVFVDMQIFWRRKQIEAVLPEFLILASSNMRAGMLIDQALMYSIKPKFGILSKEMEIVLKEVMAGKELPVALREFTERYDSPVLNRSFDIIIEGVESGGKTAYILNKIGLSLSELSLQKKEMSASVTTYAIFISFASIVAAPVLMALAGILLDIIKNMMLTLEGSLSSEGPMSFMNFTAPTLTQSEFIIFSVIMLSVTSIFSSMIITSIRKGEIRHGLKYIPVYAVVSISIFFASFFLFNSLLGGVFVW